jgi:hypothetical protein
MMDYILQGVAGSVKTELSKTIGDKTKTGEIKVYAATTAAYTGDNVLFKAGIGVKAAVEVKKTTFSVVVEGGVQVTE